MAKAAQIGRRHQDGPRADSQGWALQGSESARRKEPVGTVLYTSHSAHRGRKGTSSKPACQLSDSLCTIKTAGECSSIVQHPWVPSLVHPPKRKKDQGLHCRTDEETPGDAAEGQTHPLGCGPPGSREEQCGWQAPEYVVSAPLKRLSSGHWKQGKWSRGPSGDGHPGLAGLHLSP